MGSVMTGTFIAKRMFSFRLRSDTLEMYFEQSLLFLIFVFCYYPYYKNMQFKFKRKIMRFSQI